jgi:hypothetical protein
MKFVMIAFVASAVLALVALAAPPREPRVKMEVQKASVIRVVARSS